MITRLWITGYRSFELGIFNKKDKKVEVLEKLLESVIKKYIDNGLEWVISGAQLGIEQYSIDATSALKKDGFEIRHAVMLPFNNFGKNWNETNRINFQNDLEKVDYYNNVSNNEYESPVQLKNWQKFMLTHTDALMIIYDPENEMKGKSEYDFEAAKNYAKKHDYPIEIVTFEDLDEFIRNIQDQ